MLRTFPGFGAKYREPDSDSMPRSSFICPTAYIKYLYSSDLDEIRDFQEHDSVRANLTLPSATRTNHEIVRSAVVENVVLVTDCSNVLALLIEQEVPAAIAQLRHLSRRRIFPK